MSRGAPDHELRLWTVMPPRRAAEAAKQGVRLCQTLCSTQAERRHADVTPQQAQTLDSLLEARPPSSLRGRTSVRLQAEEAALKSAQAALEQELVRVRSEEARLREALAQRDSAGSVVGAPPP